MTAPTSAMGYMNPTPGVAWWAAARLEETPELRWPYSVGVYSRMRRQDAQVRSVLRAVTLPVLRTAWRVDPNGARDEVVELVSEDLGLPVAGADSTSPTRRTRGRFSWRSHLTEALTSLTYGHAVFEQEARIDERGRARLRKLALRPARTISAWHVARDGGLEAIEQRGGGMDRTGVWAAQPIPVSRLAVYTHEREGAEWTGDSLLRPAYKNWLIKDQILRTWAQGIDRNAMGVPVYEDGPGNKHMTQGLAMAQGYRSGDNSGAAIPHGAKLRLAGVEGALLDPEPAVRYHDEQIARATLAHFLNLGTQTGSWALGTTFADFFVMSLQTVAESVADVANAHVVEDLVDWNWGPDEPAPRLVFDEIGSRHAATAAAIKMLIDAGALSNDPALERHLRQTYGLPSADPDAPPADPTEDS